jgi:hypothetical protein
MLYYYQDYYHFAHLVPLRGEEPQHLTGTTLGG